jgi:chemotaxis protein CheX
MRIEELARILEAATADVFGTMLATDLEVSPAFENPEPFLEAEVTGFIGLSGAFRGYVALHASLEQSRDFTARLLGAGLDTVGSDEELRDAVGEIANMIAGNVKRELVRHGGIDITLPSVSLRTRAAMNVPDARGVVVPLTDYTGRFHVELVVGGR